MDSLIGQTVWVEAACPGRRLPVPDARPVSLSMLGCLLPRTCLPSSLLPTYHHHCLLLGCPLPCPAVPASQTCFFCVLPAYFEMVDKRHFLPPGRGRRLGTGQDRMGWGLDGSDNGGRTLFASHPTPPHLLLNIL